MEKPIVYNNIGCSFIECGDFKGAIKSLRIAFRSFRKAQHRLQKAGNTTDIAGGGSNSSNHSTTIDTRGNHSDDEQGSSSSDVNDWMRKHMALSEDEDNNHMDIVVYKHPMYIPLTRSLEQERLVLAAIAFNLAMAHHFLGMKEEEEKNARYTLKAAVFWYKLGLSVERTCRGKLTPFFLLTVLNNLGHIHRTMKDDRQSQSCFRQMLSTLMYLVHHHKLPPQQPQHSTSSSINSRGGGSSSDTTDGVASYKREETKLSDLEMFFENTKFGLNHPARSAAMA